MSSLENSLFFITFFLYLISASVYLAFFWFRLDKALKAAAIIFAAALALHSAALAARCISGGRLPFANMCEFLLVFSWGLSVLYFASCSRYKMYSAGIIILPLQVLIFGYALTTKTAASPLVPALQSVWLYIHVAAAVVAYSFFTLSFATAVFFLWQERKENFGNYGGVLAPLGAVDYKNHSLFTQQGLDKLVYSLIAAGFPFMTMVLITGAVWAEEAWGAWWNWDPKETWALITWLIYAIYLHLRRTRQWSGRVAAWVALSGFLAVIFTLFGVTLLVPGAHSY